MVDCPCVITDGPGKYLLFYTGHGTNNHKWGVGAAESEDLFNWKKSVNNPVLLSGGVGEWDQRIDGPTALKHDNGYYLFYEASSAFSPDEPAPTIL